MAEYTCSVNVAVSATNTGDDKARVSIGATATIAIALSERACNVGCSALASVNVFSVQGPLASGRYRR